ncbi:MAG: DUF929 family protein [Candidatus Micrarchaeaceae archaeon]|jgi:hypothetical protein|nr:DUF929 family protein [Candidatus Micrarchaeota archaeon]HII09965.1 DUF929 family protein [Candidatus Micrarchaeota archaeon]
MASLKKEIKLLKTVIALLVIIIAALAVYVMYPYINLAVVGQPFGKRLTGIDTPLSSGQLSVINNAPNSNFETAWEKVTSLSIPGEQYAGNYIYTAPYFDISPLSAVRVTPPLIGGRPSVIYIGAISCVYCGESRWAMALALSRFGSFNRLYIGYSALGDSDVPTLYWNADNYTTNSGVTFGNGYSSSYINFISAEYDSPITGGFEFVNSQDPISYFVARAPNQSYEQAMSFMNGTSMFEGTPFTLWGRSLSRGAAGVIFGNATSSETTGTTNILPLTYMSQSQILNQLQQFNSSFSYEEYAAADVYVAQVCASINNAASVCSLPAITTLEKAMGLA